MCTSLNPPSWSASRMPHVAHHPHHRRPGRQRPHRHQRGRRRPPPQRHDHGQGQQGEAERQPRAAQLLAGVERLVAPDVGDAGGPHEERPAHQGEGEGAAAHGPEGRAGPCRALNPSRRRGPRRLVGLAGVSASTGSGRQVASRHRPARADLAVVRQEVLLLRPAPGGLDALAQVVEPLLHLVGTVGDLLEVLLQPLDRVWPSSVVGPRCVTRAPYPGPRRARGSPRQSSNRLPWGSGPDDAGHARPRQPVHEDPAPAVDGRRPMPRSAAWWRGHG